MSDRVIGKLQTSNDATLYKLLQLKDSQVTSSGLELKLTEENLKVLIDQGLIGHITEPLDSNEYTCENSLQETSTLNLDPLNQTQAKPREMNTKSVNTKKKKKRDKSYSEVDKSDEYTEELSNKKSSRTSKKKDHTDISVNGHERNQKKQKKRNNDILSSNEKKSESVVSKRPRHHAISKDEGKVIQTTSAKVTGGSNKSKTNNNVNGAKSSECIDKLHISSSETQSQYLSKGTLTQNVNRSCNSLVNANLQSDTHDSENILDGTLGADDDVGNNLPRDSSIVSDSLDHSEQNIYLAFHRVGLDLDKVIQRMNQRDFTSIWEKAGPNARLVLYRKQSPSGNKSEISLLILRDTSLNKDK